MNNDEASLPHLEKALSEITQLIETMEHGELTLEQSLTHFERGITLVKHCQKILTAAEQKVQLLVQQNDENALVDFALKKEEVLLNEERQ